MMTDDDKQVIRSIEHFDGAFDETNPHERVRGIRSRAARFREDMLAREPVTFYKSAEIVRVPYPTKYGLLNAARVPSPFIHICNRVFVVQFNTPVGLKTLLVSPSDPDGNAETPFFKRFAEQFGVLEELGTRLVAPRKNDVEDVLDACGIAPAEVDYITYDHLHTQDIRKWLGADGEPGLLPNAKLLVMRQEWESARYTLPPQRDWYCPNGTDGVDEERIIALDGDVRLGDSVFLVRTPGHTEGNHSIVAHTPEGMMVTSENGVGPDAYAPEHSDIPGLKDYVAKTGMEVVLNGNTLERGLDQYVSMILEKEIAGMSIRDPRFPNMVCSSEFDSFWAFPGIEPTFRFGDLEFGRVQHAEHATDQRKARAAE